MQDLVKIGRADLSNLAAGEGVIQIAPKAFGSLTATIVAGADAAGTDAAGAYLARRVPYVWDNRRGALSLGDVKTEASKFLAARSAAGQASQALGEIEAVLREIGGHENGAAGVQSFDVTLFLETADAGLDQYLTGVLSKALASAKVTVKSQSMTAPTPVIDETIDVPWEVDEFWTRFRSEVLPKVAAGATVDLEARLSESPEYRQTIADQARAELTKAGATTANVRILSAYKQGYLWLTERVIPELKGKGARAVHVKVAEHKPDLSKKFKFYQVPSRWLHELYPVDDIIQRELGINKEQFSLELVDSPKETYTVEALDANGRVIHTASFSPKVVEREYMDKFPGWSRVEVTTGWLSASVNGQVVADARIQTDPERFWDQYQAKILPRIYDHVMKVTENRPLPDKQPFHRDLDVEVWMSEPDFRIGVDEELVSSLESLHEDLYFVTLDFFDALGRTTTRRRLAAPGKIFPIIHPERRGQKGQVHVLYAGNASAKPQLEIRYTEKGGQKPETVRRELTKIDTTRAASPEGRRPRRCGQRDRAAGRTEGRSRGGPCRRCVRQPRAPARGRLVQDGALVRPRRSRGPGDCAEGHPHAARHPHHRRRGAVERQDDTQQTDAPGRRVGPRDWTGRVRVDRRSTDGVSRGQGVSGRRVVSRPAGVGARDHTPRPR